MKAVVVAMLGHCLLVSIVEQIDLQYLFYKLGTYPVGFLCRAVKLRERKRTSADCQMEVETEMLARTHTYTMGFFRPR